MANVTNGWASVSRGPRRLPRYGVEMGYGYSRAACEWVRHGGAIRRIAGLAEPEMVIMPDGTPVAIVDANYALQEEHEAFEKLLGRLLMLRYGNAEARDHLRAWVRDNPAA